MTITEQKLDFWRNRLLDLSRSNRLINSTAPKTSGRISRVSLAINEPDALSLWKTFAEDERSISFPQPGVEAFSAPAPEKTINTASDATPETDPVSPREPRVSGDPDLELIPTKAQFGEPGSITNQSVAETVKTLRTLYNKARSYDEETGINALYLAFGFINWQDPKDGKDLRSPLLLVPVQLSQADLFSPFVLSRLDDEVTANYALSQKLAIECKVSLPEYHDELSLTDYIELVAQTTAAMSCQIETGVELSLFSFNKLSMYNDLDLHREKVVNHPVVMAIAGDASRLNRGDGFSASGSGGPEGSGGSEGSVGSGNPLSVGSYLETNFDHDAIDPREVFSVLDGDSSQQDAIQQALLGESFVLQGPPGTGKSQTITNIIAEFLARGKRVLFVSEKMAALDVVHRRLIKERLGDFCLTLHSHNSKRREVLDQLEASLELAQNQASVKDSAYQQLQLLTEQRKQLNEYAHQLHATDNPLGRSVYDVYGSLATLNDTDDLAFRPANAGSYSAAQLTGLTTLLANLARLIGQWGYQKHNPWWGCILSQATNQLKQDIINICEHIKKTLDQTTVRASAEGRFFSPQMRFNDLAKCSDLSKYYPHLDKIRQQQLQQYNDSILNIDGAALLERCKTKYNRALRSLDADFRADRAAIQAARLDRQKPSPEEMRRVAEALSDYQATWQQAQAIQNELRIYNNLDIWLAADVHDALDAQIRWFAGLFVQPEQFLDQPLDRLLSRIEHCAEQFTNLEHYIDYRVVSEQAAAAGIGAYVTLLTQLQTPAEDIVRCFEKCFYRAWLDDVMPILPAISRFRRINQDDLIESFRQLDKDHLHISRDALHSLLVNRLPALDSLSANYDEVGILRRELAKKRKYRSTRRLISDLPNLLPVLKPCMMMSPLSISTYLGDSDISFDIVLFDEASQIRTEDAICALFRARQAIVVGDSRQLPPSDFFTTSMVDDDELGDDETGLMEDAGAYESLLDESSQLQSQNLLWHYRSRHESLIAFSNARLYSNRLITFPSSLDHAPDLGVEYVHVPGAVYLRGSGRNDDEAAAVADLVFSHIDRFPDRSLGIVAFGANQQQAIEDALQARRRQSPEYEYFFKEDRAEPLFIKNLETVQGDERDTIIFDIGYGFDASGKFSMNFGPLNREGGERRLNVAITRARTNVKLVGSIMPYDIDVDRVSNLGPRLLREYIDYALRGVQVIQEDQPAAEAASTIGDDFVLSVYEFLTAQGFTVEKNVGCSGYRIDMAVRHPALSDRYAIGIECDGQTYRSARTARDRDRVRSSVLQGMGWNLYRVWSTDWTKDPRGEAARLLHAVNAAIEGAGDGPIDGPGNMPVQSDDGSSSYLEIHEHQSSGAGAQVQTDYFGAQTDQVPSTDLIRVMTEVVATSFGIDREGLFTTTARSYGWQRRGNRINERLEYAFRLLLATGRIQETGGRITLVT